MKKAFLMRTMQAVRVFVFVFSLMLVMVFVVNKFPSTEGWRVSAGVVDIWDGSIADSFAGGNGTNGNPYQISNGAQLAYLAKVVNEDVNSMLYNNENIYYKLTNDIILNDTSNWQNWQDENPKTTTLNKWTQIGSIIVSEPTDLSKAFCANFDGGSFVVRGIYINTSDYYQGLFGWASGSTIQNIGVEQSCIKANSGIGGVAGGIVNYGSIINCYNTGVINGANGVNVCYVGGVAGYVVGSVVNSYNTGVVTGGVVIGGVAGLIANGYGIANSYNTGVVTGTGVVAGIGGQGNYVGGVAGLVSCSNITNSYNIGIVTGTDDYVGGVAGYVDGNSSVAYGYYLTGIAINGIGCGTGKTITFQTNGSMASSANNYRKNNLLAALNAWVKANQTNPTTYSSWKGTPYSAFVWDSKEIVGEMEENNINTSIGDKGGCNNTNSTNAVAILPILLMMLGVAFIKSKR